MSCFLDIETLAKVANRLRENKETVVLTHGAFDLFHVGHASLLKESKKKGDHLIIGLDSDERITRYKIRGRPVIPLEERVKILLENKSVDFVFAIEEEEISENYFVRLYRKLRPQIVTCGKKFQFVDQFIERNRYYGLSSTTFDLIRHPYEDVQSTTKIISRIKTGVES